MAGSDAASAAGPKSFSPKELLEACGGDPAKAEQLAKLAAAGGGSMPTPKSPEELLAEAEKLRGEGNEKFKAGDLKAAILAYEKAVASLNRALSEDDPFNNDKVEADEAVVEKAKTLRIPVRLNLALCCLRLEPPEAFKALQLCEAVLCEEPDNPKATYRKAKALLELGEIQEAEYELVRACKLSPADKTVRQDLDNLRQRCKRDKENEKKMMSGLFDKDPGFASSDRSSDAKAAGADEGPDDVKYTFLRQAPQNPFTTSEHPEVEALGLQVRGRLEDAIFAWEAALVRSADHDAAAHFGQWVSLGRLYMDMNVDCVALRCLNRAAGIRDVEVAAGQPPEEVRRVALLLRAVCLLNEAGEQALEQVSACLEQWLDAMGAPEADDADVLARIDAWRNGGGGGADAAVAQGLLRLLHGRADAPSAFAAAVVAAEDGAEASSSSCFGSAERLAVRWNMLGAVLASRGRCEEAVAVYDEALALQPYYPRALTNRGLSLHTRNDNMAAAGAWTAAVGLLPNWATVMTWPLLAKAVEGDPALAEAAEQRSLPRLRELLGAAAEVPSQRAGKPPAAVLGPMKLLE
mmetsp:Transcript_98030/g.282764  ORF Transcript_98030/g.282764 Transcript_98030/m.282764 type:complete len:578 (-) Transcript_98030:29-1762(-)